MEVSPHFALTISQIIISINFSPIQFSLLPQYFHQGEYFHQKPLQQVLDSSYQLRTKNTAQPKTKTEIRLIQCSKVNTAIQFSLQLEERSAEKMLLNATDLILN